MGSHTKHGGYIIDWDKVRTYVVPQNLKDFKVGLGDTKSNVNVEADLLVAHTFRFEPNQTSKRTIRWGPSRRVQRSQISCEMEVGEWYGVMKWPKYCRYMGD